MKKWEKLLRIVELQHEFPEKKDIVAIIKRVFSEQDTAFVVPLKMWGNSYVLKVPPEVGKLYKLGTELKVTLEEGQ